MNARKEDWLALSNLPAEGSACAPACNAEGRSHADRPAQAGLSAGAAQAGGKAWSSAKMDELLSAVDYAGSNLEDWLRNGFFDAVQHLYDPDKTRWRFVLCGSSARKLRRIGANLLPGRSFYHRLLPLTLAEHPANQPPIPYAVSPLPFTWGEGQKHERPFPAEDLLTRLAFGDLPGVVAAPESDRAELLRAFAFVHLKEEVRREALVKDWGAFVRFMQLAAAESGQIVNFAAISHESGVSQPTVKSHYQLLEDMFVGFRVEAFSRSPRKTLLSTPKFLFFDLGVRHAAAGLMATPDVVKTNPG